MALITDPDNLSQGATTAVSDMVFSALDTNGYTTITSAGTGLPATAAGDFFEIRDHSTPDNNGLYQETGGTPTTGSITALKITGNSPSAAASEAATVLGNTTTKKSVHIDTSQRKIYLLEQGLLSTDGVTLVTLYSFLKEEWKDDPALIPYDFPMTAITSEQFEFNYNWEPTDVTTPAIQTRKLIRTGGWQEIDTDDGARLKAEYLGVITLGDFEDSVNDNAYYQVGTDPTDTGAAIDFTFAGPVNEAILTYEENVPADAGTGVTFTDGGGGTDSITRNDAGSWITDGYKVGSKITVLNATTPANNGTYTIVAVTAGTISVPTASLTADTADNTATFARNYRSAIKLFLRVRDADPNGKLFAQSNLSAIGITGDTTNKVERFPLSNATDLKITETDANITSQSPYTEINVKYFDQAFTLDVGAAARSFGIVIDVGTFSGVDGVSNGTTTFTTAEAGIPATTYDGGTLIIHEGTDKGIHTVTTATGGTVTLSSALTGSESALSFSLQRSTPIVATAEKIYEKVQYLLRQAADVDNTDQVVTGKTADALLLFVGDSLKAGQGIPSNPNGGGSGVFIEGFDSNDTNRISFFDNSGLERNFPFVAAGTINFNDNLVNDTGPAKYWMFYDYTTRTTVTDMALSASSGSTASLDSAGSNLPTLAQNDYIRLLGFTDPNNNGVWRVTDVSPTALQADVIKIDGSTVSNETGASRTLDKNPVDSPAAILVDNNSGVDITGTIGGASVSFDFDYENNVQGGRTADTNANIILRALGLNTGQFVEATGVITKNTGLTFSLVAGLERNYSNP